MIVSDQYMAADGGEITVLNLSAAFDNINHDILLDWLQSLLGIHLFCHGLDLSSMNEHRQSAKQDSNPASWEWPAESHKEVYWGWFFLCFRPLTSSEDIGGVKQKKN